VAFMAVEFDTPSIIYMGTAVVSGKPFFFL